MAIQAQMYSGFILGSSQDLLIENACGLNNLCFIPQQQKPQQEQELAHTIPFLPKDMGDLHPTSFPETIISSHIENQRIEIDLLINSQNERLKMALQEQRKQQTSLLMKKYESKFQSLINQKEVEMVKAASRNTDLQNHLRRMEIEKQTWERVAKEKEAMVASLNRTIQQLREAAVANAVAAEDADSCCVEEERERERWDQDTRKMVCRCCNSRNSCVIMLPCRHLCSCNNCEAFLDSCPVCKMVKKASIEALV